MKASVASCITRAVVFAFVCTPALTLRAQNQPADSQPIDDMKALAAKPTPKTPDGHPDLNGHWVPPHVTRIGRGSYGRIVGNEHDLIFGIPITGDAETDAAVTEDLNTRKHETAKKRAETGPQYKPELQAKVEMMGKDPNHYDPTVYSCLPPGVPRMGAPRGIIQTPGVIVLLYGPEPYSTYREIPADGRAHRSQADVDPTPMGDPVGHWDGDTFVIDSVNFDDTTWFGAAGYFHSDAMHVIERLTRKGDTLEYSATVEDPKVLTKPYNMNPTVLKKGGDNDVLFNDDLPCDISGNHDFRQHADHEHNIVN